MNNKIILAKLKVVNNEQINSSHFRLYLTMPDDCPPITPGQFAEIYVPPTLNSFLRIPLSIHFISDKKNEIQFLIQLKGEGTKYLKTLKKNDFVDIIMPLGKGFSIPRQRKLALIAGGCGVAPLLFLSDKLYEHGNELEIYLGFRNHNQVMLINEFKKYGKLVIATDDGSMGEKGVITQVFERHLDDFDFIYACGPTSMLQSLMYLSEKYNIKCEISLETLMACGLGACLCCAVPTKKGNMRACVDGPVFDTKDLIELNE